MNRSRACVFSILDPILFIPATILLNNSSLSVVFVLALLDLISLERDKHLRTFASRNLYKRRYA